MMRKVRTALIVGVVVAAVCGIGYVALGFMGGTGEGFGTYSSGVRTGYVIKFSQKGTMVKSWEGTLLIGYDRRGFMASVEGGKDESNQPYSNVWNFSVAGEKAEAIGKTIDQAIVSGKRVVLRYDQALRKGFAVDTSYLVNECVIADE